MKARCVKDWAAHKRSGALNVVIIRSLNALKSHFWACPRKSHCWVEGLGHLLAELALQFPLKTQIDDVDVKLTNATKLKAQTSKKSYLTEAKSSSVTISYKFIEFMIEFIYGRWHQLNVKKYMYRQCCRMYPVIVEANTLIFSQVLRNKS